MQPKFLDINPAWLAVLLINYPTANNYYNLIEGLYKVYFAGTTRFAALCPYYRNPVLVAFRNDYCSVLSIGRDGWYYALKSEGEMPTFRESCPFYRVLIAMRFEPCYYGQILEKLFLRFVPIKLSGRLTIISPEGSIRRPSSSQQNNSPDAHPLAELNSILVDSGCLKVAADDRPTGNLY